MISNRSAFSRSIAYHNYLLFLRPCKIIPPNNAITTIPKNKSPKFLVIQSPP